MRTRAAQLVVAPDTPPFAGNGARAPAGPLCDGVTSVASRFFQRRLLGAATAAPRRCVVREAGVQVNDWSVSRMQRSGVFGANANAAHPPRVATIAVATKAFM